MASERGIHGETVTTTEARQGVTGHNVRYVLTISTIAVIVGFAIVYAFFF
jgi:hypothetical protein